MIGAHSLRDLIGIVTNGIPQTFPGIDCVTLACVDSEYEMTRMLEAGADSDLQSNCFVAVSREELDGLYPKPWRPRLGLSDAATRSLLFGGDERAVGSVALAPLVRRGEIIGSLNQGSRDAKHFVPGIATDLLEHLAAVTALCIDNAVNHEKLKLDGLTDPLTSVANRRFFERRLVEEVERWTRQSGPLVCMLADVDHFKRINDQYGHQAGDRVLQKIASLLGHDLRASDVLARYGGEEFVLLLPNTRPDQGAAIAERLRTRVAGNAFVIAEGEFADITVSVGFACLKPGVEIPSADPASWLIKQVDEALYRAKDTGRNRVVLADSTD